jgi:large subunit ribosomal protein L31e
MEKKKEILKKSLEREYVIPLRANWKKVPRYKRANKAIKTIKEFLVRHMKVYDRNLNKIKIDGYLNEFIWFRGIKKPPAKVRVIVKKEEGENELVQVRLKELPKKLNFKKIREDKLELLSKEKIEKKKAEKKEVEPKEEEKVPSESKQESVEEKKEKKASVIEEGKIRAKEDAKKTKHTRGGKQKEQKFPKRKSLAK